MNDQVWIENRLVEGKAFFVNETKGQEHINLKIHVVCDTSPPKDEFSHHIWRFGSFSEGAT